MPPPMTLVRLWLCSLMMPLIRYSLRMSCNILQVIANWQRQAVSHFAPAVG